MSREGEWSPQFERYEQSGSLDDEPTAYVRSPRFNKVREARPPQYYSYSKLIKHLTNKLADLELQIERRRPLSHSENTLHRSLCDATRELRESLKVIRLLRHQNVTLDGGIKTAEFNSVNAVKNLERAIAKNSNLSHKAEEQAAFIEKLVEEKSNLNSEIQALEVDLSKSKETSGDSEQRNTELLTQNSALQTELTEYKSREPGFDKRILDLEASLAGANKVVSEKSAELLNLKRQLQDNESKFLVEKRKEYDQGYENGSKSQERTINQLITECDKHKGEIEKQDRKLNEQEQMINERIAKESELSTKIASMESELKLLKRERDEESSRAIRLQNDVNRLKSNELELSSEHKKDFDMLESKYSKSRDQIEKCRQKLGESVKLCENIESSRLKLELECSKARNELKEIKVTLYEKDAKIVTLKDQCSSLQRSVEANQVAQTSLQETIKEHRETISALTMRLEKVKSADLEHIQSQLRLKTEEYTQVKAAEQALRQECSAQSAQWSVYHGNLSSEIETLSSKINALEQELNVYRANESSSDAQIRERYEELFNKRIGAIMNEAEYFLNLKDQELSDIKKSREFLKENFQQSRTDFAHMQMELENVRAQLENSAPNEQRIPVLLSQVSELTQLKSKHLSEIDQLKISLQSFENQASNMDKLNHQLSELQNQLNSNSTEIDTLQSNLKTALTQKSEVENQLSIYANRVHQLESELSSVQTASINESQNVEQISQLKIQLASTFQRLSELEAAKGTTNSELGVAKRNYESLLARVCPLLERQEVLITRLRFMKTIYNHYCPLEQSIVNSSAREKRTLKQAFLFALAIVKFRNAGQEYKNNSPLIQLDG